MTRKVEGVVWGGWKQIDEHQLMGPGEKINELTVAQGKKSCHGYHGVDLFWLFADACNRWP